MTNDEKRFETKTVPWLRSELAKLKGSDQSDQDKQDAIKKLAKRKGIYLPIGWAAHMW